MSTLAEIEIAIEKLPRPQQSELFDFLAARLGRTKSVRTKARGGLKAAAYPPLEGLPKDLSAGTRERVGALLAARHASNR